MDATICVRCGLPNKDFQFARQNEVRVLPSLPYRQVNCIRCGLPNEMFQLYINRQGIKVTEMTDA